MEELLNKINSYNVLANLISGAVLSAAIEYLTVYSLLDINVILLPFVIYFVGVVNGRVGSLLVEPIFRRIVKFAKYDRYIAASRIDPVIKHLSETNNSYRSTIAAIVVYLLVKLSEILPSTLSFSISKTLALALVLLVMFSFSYIKQIKTITKRVDAALSVEEDSSNN